MLEKPVCLPVPRPVVVPSVKLWSLVPAFLMTKRTSSPRPALCRSRVIFESGTGTGMVTKTSGIVVWGRPSAAGTSATAVTAAASATTRELMLFDSPFPTTTRIRVATDCEVSAAPEPLPRGVYGRPRERSCRLRSSRRRRLAAAERRSRRDTCGRERTDRLRERRAPAGALAVPLLGPAELLGDLRLDTRRLDGHGLPPGPAQQRL